jgi:hypothetical protein
VRRPARGSDGVAVRAGLGQEQWLRADLAAHPNRCTLAMWHHPYFTSGTNAGRPLLHPIWQALYDYGVELVLNGHTHGYERFEPMDPLGGPRSGPWRPRDRGRDRRREPGPLPVATARERGARTTRRSACSSCACTRRATRGSSCPWPRQLHRRRLGGLPLTGAAAAVR